MELVGCTPSVEINKSWSAAASFTVSGKLAGTFIVLMPSTISVLS